jgi:hypothetical protein
MYRDTAIMGTGYKGIQAKLEYDCTEIQEYRCTGCTGIQALQEYRLYWDTTVREFLQYIGTDINIHTLADFPTESTYTNIPR